MLLFPGVGLLFAGTTFGLYHWIGSVRSGLPATAGTVVLAMLPIVLGFQLVLHALLLDIGKAPPAWRPGAGRARRRVIPAARLQRRRPETVASAAPVEDDSAPASPRRLHTIWLAWALVLTGAFWVKFYRSPGRIPPEMFWWSAAIGVALCGAIGGVAVAAGAIWRRMTLARIWAVTLLIFAGTAVLAGELRSWLGAACVLLIAAGPGLFVARLCGRGGTPALFVCALGLAVLSELALVASLVGAFSLVLFVGIGVAAWAWDRRLGRTTPVQEPPSGGATGLSRGDMAVVGLLWALLAVLMLQASVPEFWFDAYWAQLPLARAIAGRRYVAIPEIWWTMVPHAYQMLAGIAYELGGVMGAKLLHFLFLILNVGCAVWLGTRLYGLRSGLAAGALFLTIPLVMWNGTVGNTDMRVTFFAMGGIAALFEFLRRGGQAWLFIVGVFVGTAIAIKYFAAAVLVPVVLMLPNM